MLTCIIYEIWMKRKSIKKRKNIFTERAFGKKIIIISCIETMSISHYQKNVLTYVLILK